MLMRKNTYTVFIASVNTFVIISSIKYFSGQQCLAVVRNSMKMC